MSLAQGLLDDPNPQKEFRANLDIVAVRRFGFLCPYRSTWMLQKLSG